MRYSYLLLLFLLLLPCRAYSTESFQHGFTDKQIRAVGYEPTKKTDMLVFYAQREIGINQRENPARVLAYLESVGIKSIVPWCAAFTRKMLDLANINYPVRSGVAQHYINAKFPHKAIDSKLVLAGKKSIPSGSLVIWKRGTGWQGHIGVTIAEWSGRTGSTLEGNTSRTGSRDGGHVMNKVRQIEPYNFFRITNFVILGGV